MSNRDDETQSTPPRGAAPRRNFYGRRHGKKLRKGQKDLLATRLEALAPKGVTWEENSERRPIDLGALFPNAREIWLEIGFGGGEHMLSLAAQNPDVGIIGCEAFINGVAMLLSGINRSGVANLAIHPGDARDLLDVLPPHSLGQVFLLYPDPWPKKRHHKRRFVNPENIDPLARAMAPGAMLRVATDIGDYARHTLEVLERNRNFVWTAESCGDWRAPWPGWPGTRYEAKALAAVRAPYYLSFRRKT